jgi:hypothetical protein
MIKIEEIISGEDEGLVVDWKKLYKGFNQPYDKNYSLLYGVFEILEKNKLVSKHSPKKDDYFLSRMNVSLENLDESSCIQNNIYFFRREEDARGYVEAFWSGAVYPIYITKVIGVGNKGFDMSRKD